MRTLLACAALLGLVGCSPCVERCRVESRNLQRCLDDWDLGWGDLGAADRIDYRDRCVREQTRWLATLEGDPKATEQDLCIDLNEALRATDDCDRVWEQLVGYGE